VGFPDAPELGVEAQPMVLIEFDGRIDRRQFSNHTTTDKNKESRVIDYP